MISYKIATEKDVNSIKELWTNAFKEKPEAVDLYLSKIFPNNTCYLAFYNDSLIGMLHFIYGNVNGKKAVYLYAVATEKTHQNRGVMKGLLNYALSNVDAEICVTLPADDSLYNYYGKFGFVPLKSNTSVLTRDEVIKLSKPYAMQEVFVNGYCGIRNRIFKNNFLSWNNNFIDYAFEYNKLYGAKVVKNNFGYAVFYEKDFTCNVLELVCDDKNVPFLLTDILSGTTSTCFKFHLSPNQKCIESKSETFGMVKYLSDYQTDNIYLGLTLE